MNANMEPIGRCHVVALPYPARGHINPMMNLCKLQASRSHDLLITFVVTEEWLGFIGSESKPANLRFGTIPNVLPSELVRASDMLGFVEATLTKMEEPFEKLLDRLEPPPTVIMADVCVSWAIIVGNRRNIPVAALWPMPVAVFSFIYHFDLLVENQHYPFDLSERGDELVDYIPGISSTRLADLPTIFYKSQRHFMSQGIKMISDVSKAQFCLFSSILELEAQVINALRPKLPIPMYSFGPLIPHFTLEDQENAPDHMTSHNDTNSRKWLDSQPQGSVLYISMGSYFSISSAQMDEIVAGLSAIGVRFLWVARGEASRLKEACGDSGMVVPWCDQLKVLCHSSVGGFWSHCGWNSTMESVFAGVPMLTFPMHMDQVPISKTIVEDWRIGWRVLKREVGMENLVGREEIADLVRRFMDLESPERREMIRRVRELQGISRQAIAKGGSSEVNLGVFIRDILQLS
ncbi:UDP-glycosyltransferase 87A2-like [Cornus florida]|uniref:UDP-glycosyltransferase 87A2-like n=1 Tax=Cornus florida TaxID=4283 RepID=UPI0028A2A317|nr:UDP-glycosyltransferase 87A2-like [Cornus florida]